MTLSTTSPLYATAVFNSTNSPCASPATSTDSHCDDVRALSPSTLAKLPGLQFAISHRRGDLRLPMLTHNRVYEPTASDNGVLNHPHHSRALYLSMPHCETPHYLPGVPLCPETSPLEKKSCSVDKELDANGKKRKKGTRRGTLNAEAKNVLKAWMFSPEHFAHPYPSEEEKEELALEAGIEVKQLSNWFTNARKRLWQPVLRQSGVEVKNFLSTGRGGPRGNKLDVPANLQHLIAQKEAEDEENGSPPSSPCPSDDGESKSLKRSWDDVHSSSLDDMVIKKKKTIVRKRSKDGKKMDEEELSHELRNALTMHLENHHPTVNKFKDIEILAAASLIGLHLQPMYQPVH